MPHEVRNRQNTETGEAEYIVVDSNGIIAPPPHGGPFSSKAEADMHCSALLKMRSIEEWIAAHPENIRDEQIEGQGKVLHIAPDEHWIQGRGRNTFAVHPPTDHELEIGELVSVGKSGEIEFLDRNKSQGFSMRR